MSNTNEWLWHPQERPAMQIRAHYWDPAAYSVAYTAEDAKGIRQKFLRNILPTQYYPLLDPLSKTFLMFSLAGALPKDAVIVEYYAPHGAYIPEVTGKPHAMVNSWRSRIASNMNLWGFRYRPVILQNTGEQVWIPIRK